MLFAGGSAAAAHIMQKIHLLIGRFATAAVEPNFNIDTMKTKYLNQALKLY